MTKGQLLALDTPYEIKKKFGFGYKLLIEPKNIDAAQFSQVKANIDQIVLSAQNQALGFT